MGLWNGHATLLFTLLLAVSSSGSFALNNVNSTKIPDGQLVNTQRIADDARCVDMYCCAALLLQAGTICMFPSECRDETHAIRSSFVNCVSYQ